MKNEYPKPQGFSKNLAMPKSQWTGFIKDYDGAHLMECYIHPTVNYLDVRTHRTHAPVCLFVCLLTVCPPSNAHTHTNRP